MRQQETAQCVPGEVVRANVINGLESRRAGGKERPVVILRAPLGSALVVAGLTSKSETRDGAARPALGGSPDWQVRGTPYIFSPISLRVARHDVFEHIGWIGDHDAQVLAEAMGLEGDWHVRTTEPAA